MEGFVAAPGERLELPPPDPRAALAWVPERLPAEELVLGGGDEPVVWLEEDFTDCEGPPLVRLLAVHADGLVVETAHRGTAETEPAFRRERRIDPVRLGPLLAALNEAGFFAIRLDPREQVRKESLSPSGSRPDDGPEFRTSRLSVRLSGGTYSAAGTNLADHVRRMPDFVELAALERSLARVGEALAADPAR
ncbi:MAG: hypothetical protein H6825_09280 [Planctomycetes bacterium]|nr:hypothetical protein [Planctomycetota bacterium]